MTRVHFPRQVYVSHPDDLWVWPPRANGHKAALALPVSEYYEDPAAVWAMPDMEKHKEELAAIANGWVPEEEGG